MKITSGFALLAVAIGALPLSAQSTRERVRDRVIYGDGRTATRTGGSVGDIIYGRTTTNTTSRSKIPPGQLPPRGMCRVWIDGVPPGQQPPVTSCAQAESDRLRYGANAHVIYGDVQSFPGKGKGRYKNQNAQATRQCSIWDVVVVGGQQRDVCRDGSTTRDRNGNVIRRGDDSNRNGVYRRDDNEDRDEIEKGDESGGNGKEARAYGKGHGKGHGKGKGHG